MLVAGDAHLMLISSLPSTYHLKLHKVGIKHIHGDGLVRLRGMLH